VETLHGPGGYTYLLLNYFFFNLKIPYFTQCSVVSNRRPLTWLDRKCLKIV